jgi:hypothetical protein
VKATSASEASVAPVASYGAAAEDERRLPGRVRGGSGLAVVTGGQTGVDTLAARAALRAGLAVHLVFPTGLLQEDGPLIPARRRALRGATLHELGSASFRYRTWTCVYLCDVVVLIDPAGGDGCAETARAAASLDRPLLRPGPDLTDAAQFAGWLGQTAARVLMVAGCRASLLTARDIPRIRAHLAAIMAGAAEHDRRLRASSRPQA